MVSHINIDSNGRPVRSRPIVKGKCAGGKLPVGDAAVEFRRLLPDGIACAIDDTHGYFKSS